jgi:hypothetical protein
LKKQNKKEKCCIHGVVPLFHLASLAAARSVLGRRPAVLSTNAMSSSSGRRLLVAELRREDGEEQGFVT